MANREDDEPEASGNKRARARGFAEKAPKEPPYEDPIDRQAREAEGIDARELVIAQLMAQGRWTKLKALQYGNLWAVAPKTVANYASNANRLRRQVAGGRALKSAQRRTLDQLQAAYELAMAQGDPKAAAMAAKTMGEIQGAFPSKRVEKDAEKPAPHAGLPPEIALYAHDERLVRLYELLGRRLTSAQVTAVLAGTPPEEVAKGALASMS